MDIEIKDGGTYRIYPIRLQGVALNAYGSSATTNGQNVCLYKDTPSDTMQDWIIRVFDIDEGSYRIYSANNTNLVLDRSDGSLRTSRNNNAHLCKLTGTSPKDSEVMITTPAGDSQGHVFIKLKAAINGQVLYLTSTNYSSSDSTPSSITSSMALNTNGNVYWAPQSSATRAYQYWRLEKQGDSGETPPPDPEPEPGNSQKLCLPLNSTIINTGYKEYAPGYEIDGVIKTHYGVDLIGSTFSGDDKRFFASGNGEILGFNAVYIAKSGYIVGRWVAVKYYNVEHYGDLVVRYFHLDAVGPDLYVGKKVDLNTVIGTMGQTGDYCYGRHLHVEVDTDVANWKCTPTLSGASKCGLMAGTRGDGDTTLNPLDVFKCKVSPPENQTCSVENDGKWCSNIQIPDSFV